LCQIHFSTRACAKAATRQRVYWLVVGHETSKRGPGDPDGRRLARRRSIQLAEAGRVARALTDLLHRANFESASARALTKAITAQEQSELMRASGRVESRRRFKINGRAPLHDNRTIDNLFIDESGRAEPNCPDPTFTVAGISMSAKERGIYVRAADALKKEFFGTADFTFHEPAMRRHEQLYSFGGNLRRRQEFCEALDGLVRASSFVAFGVAIRKSALASFMASTVDPYLPLDVYAVAIHLLLERYVDYLAAGSVSRKVLGRVTFESQGPKEDAAHQQEYVGLLLGGTQWVPESAFQNWLETGVRFTRKQGTEPMELADMFSRDLYEWAKTDCASSPRRWGIFGEKVYRRGDLAMGKFGVKVFPDSDIRERIEAHRLGEGATN
jgi:hypothetical protein